MSQTTSELATPGAPLWVCARNYSDGSTSSPLAAKAVEIGSGFAIYPHDTATDPPKLTLIWQSSYSAFQVQWRTRRRYSPAHAAAVYGTTGEQWTEWGDWSGATITGTETATAATRTTQGWLMDDLAQFPFVYDFSQYDQTEVQARVRVYDALNGKCSEWATGTLTAYYRIVPTVTAAQNSDGTVTVTFASSWQRGGTVTLQKVRRAVSDAPCVTGDVTSTSNTATVEVTIPKDKLAGLSATANKLAARQFIYRPAQNTAWQVYLGTASGGNHYVTMTKHANPSGIIAPVVNVDDTGAVSVADSNYSAVFAAAWWEDEEARPYAAEVELQDSGDAWTGALVAPPYDVPLTIRAVAVSSDGALWAQTLTTITIDSDGRHSWTLDNGESVNLTLRQDMAGTSISEKLEGETIKPAGRSRPVSRHGIGGTRTLSVSGVILRGDLTDNNADFKQPSHAEAMALLRTEEDIWYRTPGGGRYRVMVTSFSASQYRNYETISIDMEEVG